MSANNALVFAQQQRIAQLEEKLAEPPCCRVSFLYGRPGRWNAWKHFYTSEKEFQQLRAALTCYENGRTTTLTEIEDVKVWDATFGLDSDSDCEIRKLLGSWKAGTLFTRDASACHWMFMILCSIYYCGRLREYKPMFDRVCILHPVRGNDSPVYKDVFNIIIESTWS